MDLEQERQQWWDRWQEGRTGFHRPEADLLPTRYIHALASDTHPNEKSCILVSICGKSKDLIWLQSYSHQVIGVVLVSQAVDAFLGDNQITPTRSSRNPFTVYQHVNLAFLQGNIFQMSSKHLESQPIQAILDLASLITLSGELRKNYVALLRDLVSPNTKMLLVTLTYEEGLTSGLRQSVSENETFELFAFASSSKLLGKRDIFPESSNFQKAGLRWTYEAVYLITFP
jgi:thiopurine S-methyltransferase